MRMRLFGLAATWLCCLLSHDSACGQNESATVTASTPDAHVELLSSYLKGDREGGVEIKDFVLDLDTAHVALQIASWKHSEQGKQVVAVTPFDSKLDAKRATAVARQLTSSEPPAIDRRLATSVYQQFGRDIYWSKYLSQLSPEAHKKFDPEAFELTSFSHLKGKKVVDMDWELLGIISDLGVAEDSGAIVYCLVQAQDRSQRAIPLGAFVDHDPKKDWEIELKQEQVLAFEPIQTGHVPQKIDRGWQEYVAVRYGRDALQTEPQVPATDK